MKVIDKGMYALAWFENKKSMLASKTKECFTNQEGASTVEYALVLGIIVLGVVSAGTALFSPLREFFSTDVKKAIVTFLNGSGGNS